MIKLWGTNHIFSEWNGEKTRYYQLFRKLDELGVMFPNEDKFIYGPQFELNRIPDLNNISIGPMEILHKEKKDDVFDFSKVMEIVTELGNIREMVEEVMVNNTDSESKLLN